MYSVNAANRTIKLKCEGNKYVPLDTTHFDSLLDSITDWLHSTHQERMRAAEVERQQAAVAAAERAAQQAAEHQAQLVRAAQAEKERADKA